MAGTWNETGEDGWSCLLIQYNETSSAVYIPGRTPCTSVYIYITCIWNCNDNWYSLECSLLIWYDYNRSNEFIIGFVTTVDTYNITIIIYCNELRFLI